ncbi:MAG: methyltransferase [Flavobacteriaceae bacterium]|nr:methyltransferase [Flavobacteriaceae bacterium]
MEPFKFKLFTIQQDKCAMKVGTDGVLLGAWVTLHTLPNSILDIGTGTGIIALQLAQRSEARIIDAIEIDHHAFEQAVENFENSSWNDRIFCYHVSLAAFTDEIDQKYDLIVSNPPFYNDEFESNNEARNKARFTSSLSFEDLLDSVSKLLSRNGTFATIIPYKEEANFIKLAEQYQLKINKICRVKGNKNTEIKRSLLLFSKDHNKVELTQLIIEKERHQYTDAYQKLVKDFYLKM